MASNTHPPVFNNALFSAMDMVNSERSRTDAKLMDDFQSIMRGNCFYLKEFVCRRKDNAIFDRLKEELSSAFGGPSGMGSRTSSSDSVATMSREKSTSSMTSEQSQLTEFSEVSDTQNTVKIIKWSKHQLIENPTTSNQFNELIAKISDYFDLEVYQTRLNYYADATSWKPFHHDSHAYGGKALREDFTAGISLGASRDLAFLHPESERQFAFHQENGDVFAFTNEVNTKFQHGVPKVTCGAARVGPRFSIIAWGRRRSINERNGGAAAVPRALKGLSEESQKAGVLVGGRQVEASVVAAAQDLVAMEASTPAQQATTSQKSTADGDKKKEKKKRRLQ